MDKGVVMKKTMRFFCFNFLFIICLFLFFSGCATTNSAVATGSPGGSDRTSAGTPDWVRDPYIKYDMQTNFAVVGTGKNRQEAEKNALGNLVAIFGQSIQVDEKIAVSYQEAVRSGVTASWSENTAVNSTIATSASMDTLIGAETGEVWDNGRNTYYAVVILNKVKAAQIYSGMIQSNQAMIENLINMPIAEKNTLEGYSRYQFAATIADINASYESVLAVIGIPSSIPGIQKGNDLRLEAANIAKAIPVNVVVKNDRNNRIRDAFSKVLSNLGFQSGGNNSRYRLEAEVNLSEAPSQQHIYVRYEINANFYDGNRVLIPYNINDREGHSSLANAENRAFVAAEKAIAEEFSQIFSSYINRLLPRK